MQGALSLHDCQGLGALIALYHFVHITCGEALSLSQRKGISHGDAWPNP